MDKYFEYGDAEINYLKKKDKKLGAAIERIGVIKRRVNPEPFAALIESIIGQQISSKAALTVKGKLDAISEMEPEAINALALEEIQACGMTFQKAGYIKGIAEAAVSKSIDFEALKTMGDEEIVKILTAQKGIGIWTVEMLLIFSLMRPNVVSYGDLAIRRGMTNLYGLKSLSKEQFNRYAKRYSPYGSVASLYLWELSHDEGG